MERCWSDEGGLQAASLVFEHLWVVVRMREGVHSKCWEKVEEEEAAHPNGIGVYGASIRLYVQCGGRSCLRVGINRLVPHNTKQDVDPKRRGGCRGEKKYTRKKRIAISGIERSLRLGLISFRVYTFLHHPDQTNMLMFSWEGKQLAHNISEKGKEKEKKRNREVVPGLFTFKYFLHKRKRHLWRISHQLMVGSDGFGRIHGITARWGSNFLLSRSRNEIDERKKYGLFEKLCRAHRPKTLFTLKIYRYLWLKRKKKLRRKKRRFASSSSSSSFFCQLGRVFSIFQVS